jgi:hypothetical protein
VFVTDKVNVLLPHDYGEVIIDAEIDVDKYGNYLNGCKVAQRWQAGQHPLQALTQLRNGRLVFALDVRVLIDNQLIEVEHRNQRAAHLPIVALCHC